MRLEGQVTLNKRYSTLFSGLKLNTAHNSAVTQPLAFMLRRLYYSVVIVFMCHMPQVALLSLLGLCLVLLVFTIVEKPWKDSEMQKLAIVNEVFLYLVIVLVLACTSISRPDGPESDILGYMIIGVVTLAIHVNLVAMFAQALHHIKLLYARRAHSKNPKIAAQKKQAAAKLGGKIPLKQQPVADLEAQTENKPEKNLPGLPHVTENSQEEEESSLQPDKRW